MASARCLPQVHRASPLGTRLAEQSQALTRDGADIAQGAAEITIALTVLGDRTRELV